jgi:hypothetical protein
LTYAKGSKLNNEEFQKVIETTPQAAPIEAMATGVQQGANHSDSKKVVWSICWRNHIRKGPSIDWK